MHFIFLLKQLSATSLTDMRQLLTNLRQEWVVLPKYYILSTLNSSTDGAVSEVCSLSWSSSCNVSPGPLKVLGFFKQQQVVTGFTVEERSIKSKLSYCILS